jgi:hypothetical protein
MVYSAEVEAAVAELPFGKAEDGKSDSVWELAGYALLVIPVFFFFFFLFTY